MEDNIIEIRVKVVEESVNISDLTEREKQIHSHGYDMGFRRGLKQWPGILTALCMLVFMVVLISQCGQ